MGVFILVLQRYLGADLVHQLLTFNPADFFTCVLGEQASLALLSMGAEPRAARSTLSPYFSLCVSVRVHVCVRACVRVCMYTCVCVGAGRCACTLLFA